MWNSECCFAPAEIAIHFFITTTFALSYDSPHDFAGKGVLNDLNGVLPKCYLPFYSCDSVVLTVGCKLASFTINICHVISKFNFKGPSSPVRICYQQHCTHCNAPVFKLLRGRFWGFSPRRGDTLNRLGWNLARRRGPFVQCVAPAGRKNLKIGLWVI